MSFTVPAGAINLRPAQPEPTTRTGGTEVRGLVWSSLWAQNAEPQDGATDAD